MKKYLSGSALAAIAGAAMLLPLAAAPAAAQVPGGSYMQTCRDIDRRGDRVIATCRTEEGRWNRTSIANVDRCAGGLANADGRLVCQTRGGGWHAGRDRGGRDYDRGDWRDDRRDHGWRRDGYRDGYGSAYGPGYDTWGRGYGTPGGWYGR